MNKFRSMITVIVAVLMSLILIGSAEAEAVLPTGYTALEYIESTGAQHINTKLRLSENAEVEVKAEVPDLISSANLLFAAQCTDDSIFRVNANSRIGGKTGLIDFYRVGRPVSKLQVPLPGMPFVVRTEGKKLVLTVDGVSASVTGSWEAPIAALRHSLYLFAQNMGAEGVDGPAAAPGAFRMYYCKVWDRVNDAQVLVGDYLPCRDDSDRIGLYDLVGKKFLPNNGTGEFTAGPVVPDQDGWQVDFIESSGSQYINTGLKCSELAEIEMEVEVPDLTMSPGMLFGALGESGAQFRADAASHLGDRSGLMSYYRASSTQKGITTQETPPAGVPFTVRTEGNTLVVTVAGSSRSFTGGWTEPITPFANSLYLFALNMGANGTDGAPTRPSAFKLYSCKVWDTVGGARKLVGDYVPYCKRDGEVGLLNRTDNAFLSNAGTGEFRWGGAKIAVKGDAVVVSEGNLKQGKLADYGFVELASCGAFAVSESVVVNGTLKIGGDTTVEIGLTAAGGSTLDATTVDVSGASHDHPVTVKYSLPAGATRTRYTILSGGLVAGDEAKFVAKGKRPGAFHVVDGALVLDLLPYDYTQLSYIGSREGCQWIGTDWIPTEVAEIEMYANIRAGQNNRHLLGTMEQNGKLFSIAWHGVAGGVDFNRYQGTATRIAFTDFVGKDLIWNIKGRTMTVRTLNGAGVAVANAGSTSQSGLAPLVLFNRNRKADGDMGYAVTNVATSSMKLYSAKIWDRKSDQDAGISLVRDFTPCIAPDGTIGLYDLVEGEFYSNRGSSVAFEVGRLPEDDGVPLAYIESTDETANNAPWIGTDWRVTGHAEIEVRANLSKAGRTLRYIFGARECADADSYLALVMQDGHGLDLYRNRTTPPNYRVACDPTGMDVTWYLRGISCVGKTMDGAVLTNHQIGNQDDVRRDCFSPLVLFNRNMDYTGLGAYDVSARYGIGMKLHSAKIWDRRHGWDDNCVLVRDFVPWCRMSDGEIGLLDRVEGRFYPRNGGSAFVRLHSSADGTTLNVQDGSILDSDVSACAKICAVSGGKVRACEVSAFKDLELASGELEFRDGATKSYEVSGALKLGSGSLDIDIAEDGSCDSFAAGSVDLTTASSSNPVIINVAKVGDFKIREQRYTLIPSGIVLSDLDKFKLNIDQRLVRLFVENGALVMSEELGFLVIID